MILGIDPGMSGATVGLEANGDVVFITKHSEGMVDVSKSVRIRKKLIKYAILESVHSMPRQGVASSFKFGMSYGTSKGILSALRIRWDGVTPQAWQKAMGCLTKGDKNVSKMRAQQLFPSFEVTHAFADALLIAEYARREAIKLGYI